MSEFRIWDKVKVHLSTPVSGLDYSFKGVVLEVNPDCLRVKSHPKENINFEEGWFHKKQCELIEASDNKNEVLLERIKEKLKCPFENQGIILLNTRCSQCDYLHRCVQKLVSAISSVLDDIDAATTNRD